MKKLINPKTGEVAYLNLENRTIKFSKTKGTFKAYIEKDPKSKKIEKITVSAKPVSSIQLNEPIEIDNEPITEVIDNENVDVIETPIISSYSHPKMSPNEFIKLYLETAVKDLDSIGSHLIPSRPAA